MANDEGSLRGKGLGAMLPSGGNPFQPAGGGGAPKPANVDPAASPDLTPEELSRLFPDGPAPSLMNAEASGGGEGLPAWISGAPAAASTSATMPVAGAVVVTENVAPEAAMELPIAERPTGRQMFDPEIMFYGIEIKPDEIGPQATKYEEAKALEAKAELVKKFVTDEVLQRAWAEINELEQEITASREISREPGFELLNRLKVARNQLLAAEANYEEAQQEISRAKFRFTRILEIENFEKPPFIFGWLIACTLALVVASVVGVNAFGGLEAMLTRMATDDSANPTPIVFWIAVWAGGLGGVTVAFYSLWQHVAQKKDYDSEFAMWYYANPVMGLLLGLFVFFFSYANFVKFTTNWAIFLLAYAVGFQQQLIFGILNGVVQRILPSEKKGESAEA